MKILYGVQATGNGHITRARAMVPELKKAGHQVHYVFSGRKPEDLFDMGEFGDFSICQGLTLSTQAGRVQPINTLKSNSIKQLFEDCRGLDLDNYDMVLTDFEPVTAWAAKLANKTCIGIGHQYAFWTDIPTRGNNPGAKTFLRHFAPATLGLGLHWHHFGQPILPPIADVHTDEYVIKIDKKITVYLGFEEVNDVINYLKPFKDFEFYYYAKVSEPKDIGHIHLRPLSRENFQKDLASSSGVVCNAGFELASEAIQLGLKLLVKPLHGQMEQLSNALALEMLNLGTTMDSLNQKTLENWLFDSKGTQVIYPNVPAAIACWLDNGDWSQQSAKLLSESLWGEVICPEYENFTRNLVSIPSNGFKAFNYGQ